MAEALRLMVMPPGPAPCALAVARAQPRARSNGGAKICDIVYRHYISHRCAIAQNRLCRIQCAYRRYEVVRALTWFSEFDSRLVYSVYRYTVYLLLFGREGIVLGAAATRAY